MATPSILLFSTDLSMVTVKQKGRERRHICMSVGMDAIVPYE